MRQSRDELKKRILDILTEVDEPLETKEIELILKTATRTKILYRLNNLRGENLVKGKPVGSGKGTWIWWVRKYIQLRGELDSQKRRKDFSKYAQLSEELGDKKRPKVFAENLEKNEK